MKQTLIQAYRQAPWRTQLQWIGGFLLVLVVLMLIAGVYLYVSASATAAGTRIHDLEIEREALQIQLADLRTELAYLNSAEVMRARASEAGYHQASIDEIEYVTVEGYSGRSVVFLAPPPSHKPVESNLIKPAYKQSLWEWLYQGTFRLIDSKAGLQ
jgi:hypothetical protein